MANVKLNHYIQKPKQDWPAGIMLRPKKELKDWLKKHADKHKVSINKIAVALLTRAMDEEGK